MLRAAILALLLTGCDRVFGLLDVPDYVPPDAPDPIDAPPDARPSPSGCSDVTREGFPDLFVYPDIAGCAGAWSLPGLRDVSPMCGRRSGNDGAQLDGVGCSAADLCADGWHVCQTKLDVAMSQPIDKRSCADLDASAQMFFGTAQSGPGAGSCEDIAGDNTDDFMGCGTYGLAAMANCAPLDTVTGNECATIKVVGGWSCPAFNDEVNTVTKTEPLIGGGVLCCRDR